MPLASRAQDVMHADYEMTVDIRDCAAHYTSADSPPEVRVMLAAQIATAHGRNIVTGHIASGNATASADNVAAVVAAYNSALGVAAKDLVDWTLSQSLPALTELSPQRRIP